MANTVGHIDPRQVAKFLRSKSVRGEEPYEQLGRMERFVSTERETSRRLKKGDVRLPTGEWVEGSFIRRLSPEAREVLQKEGTAGLDIWRVGKAEEEARGRLEAEASKKEQELKLVLEKEATTKEAEARVRLDKEAARIQAELEKIRQSLLAREKALVPQPVPTKPVPVVLGEIPLPEPPVPIEDIIETEEEPKPDYYSRTELFKELGNLIRDYGKEGGADIYDFTELAGRVDPADREFARAAMEFVQGYGTKYDIYDFVGFAKKWVGSEEAEPTAQLDPLEHIQRVGGGGWKLLKNPQTGEEGWIRYGIGTQYRYGSAEKDKYYSQWETVEDRKYASEPGEGPILEWVPPQTEPTGSRPPTFGKYPVPGTLPRGGIFLPRSMKGGTRGRRSSVAMRRLR